MRKMLQGKVDTTSLFSNILIFLVIWEVKSCREYPKQLQKVLKEVLLVRSVSPQR